MATKKQSAESRSTSRVGSNSRKSKPEKQRAGHGRSERSASEHSTHKGHQPEHEGGAQTSTDHETIRRWAEERGAKPACVRGTGDKQDTGLLRLDFPGYSGQDSLQHISWDDWFAKFDEKNLALLYQETTKDGQKSNFNKLVSR